MLHQYTLGEFSLQGIVNKDLQASFGSSPVDRETTLHDIRNSVLTNLLMNPGHYKIRKTEFRTVNGVEIFYIQFHDVDSGYDIIRNHFITDDLYCATLSAGSPEKAFITHEKEMQSFINGAVKIKTADKLVEIINVQAPLPPPVSQKIKTTIKIPFIIMEGILICFINHLPVYYLFYQLKLKT
ncbi:hypothetical protein [Chryseobacterium arthrosphaerae]|uniref:hypothetical protein n=1 Tax=Chryseobacterium arthrosphaerae TaxID=651561 RepID=UPI001F4A8218|nr:hypothetical protein [Chryseobacterium arthrosphaerae]